MATRIKYPTGVVRTRETILEQAKAAGGLRNGFVWQTCWNCGGSGQYLSSCEPAGRCRLYCWINPNGTPKHPDTFGKLAYPVDRYVKNQQSSDRRAYRDSLMAEERAAKAAERAAAAKIEQERRDAERAERDRARLAELAARSYVGEIGQRITLEVVAQPVKRFPGYMDQTRYLCRFRDASGNLLVLWTSSLPFAIDEDGTTSEPRMQLTATVKAFETYNDEKQTIVQRARVVLLAQSAA